MKGAVAKAAILVEALPYIKEHAGKTVVIKYGGNAMVSADLKEMITSDVALMKYVGMKPVVIHGGGPEISRYMVEAGKEVEFVDGLRVTDEETIEIVGKALGAVNRELVSLINRHTLPGDETQRLAVGLTGTEVTRARRRGGPIDLGFVGQVERIEPRPLQELIEQDLIPVIASLGAGERGETLNINADTVAGEVAAALGADKMIFLTDVAGLYADLADKNSLISTLTLVECEKMLDAELISAGMLPKVAGCVRALEAGVNRAHILDGTIEHALVLEVFTREGVGTMITGD